MWAWPSKPQWSHLQNVDENTSLSQYDFRLEWWQLLKHSEQKSSEHILDRLCTRGLTSLSNFIINFLCISLCLFIISSNFLISKFKTKMLTYWENPPPPPNILIITLNWPPVPNACLQIFFSNIFSPTNFTDYGVIYAINKGVWQQKLFLPPLQSLSSCLFFF